MTDFVSTFDFPAAATFYFRLNDGIIIYINEDLALGAVSAQLRETKHVNDHFCLNRLNASLTASLIFQSEESAFFIIGIARVSPS